MKKFTRFQTGCLLVAALVACSCHRNASRSPATSSAAAEAVDTAANAPVRPVTFSELPEEPVFDIVTDLGTIKVKLYRRTPKHRENFARLALAGYYDSLLFHRVIKDFMIQGGDPNTRDASLVDLYGQGGPDYTIPAEFIPEYKHKKGALAAARRGDAANPMKASSGSQFYIVESPEHCIHLDGEYTVFGETIDGLEVIDRIAAVRTDRRGLPDQPVRILTIRLDPVSYPAPSDTKAE